MSEVLATSATIRAISAALRSIISLAPAKAVSVPSKIKLQATLSISKWPVSNEIRPFCTL